MTRQKKPVGWAIAFQSGGVPETGTRNWMLAPFRLNSRSIVRTSATINDQRHRAGPAQSRNRRAGGAPTKRNRARTAFGFDDRIVGPVNRRNWHDLLHERRSLDNNASATTSISTAGPARSLRPIDARAPAQFVMARRSLLLGAGIVSRPGRGANPCASWMKPPGGDRVINFAS